MIVSDIQRRAMFARLNASNKNMFAFDLGLFDVVSPIFAIGSDIVGDVFQGFPVLVRRSPAEGFFDAIQRIEPRTFGQIETEKIF